MKTVCPTEERLKSLICEAFNELSAADTTRLGQIGNKIGKQAQCNTSRRSKGQIWLFWLLFGASLTAAAWWGGKMLLTDTVPGPVTATRPLVSEPADTDHTTRPDTADKPTADPEQGSGQQDNPVIYRREQY